MQQPSSKLSIKIGSLELRNPIIAASGTFGYGSEYASFYSPGELGAIVVKGVSLEPMEGNPTPRISECAGGMLNAIGLQNPGLEVFIDEKIPHFKELKTAVIVNLFARSIEDFAHLAGRLSGFEEISGFEINLSCPNVEKGGVEFASDPLMIGKIVKRVRKETKLPVWVKLAPYLNLIGESARIAEQAGADALTIANAYPAMAIDISKKKPSLANIRGGLSGPAIKPLTLHLVWKVADLVKIPIVASGGVMRGEDAIEYLMAGASAVQIGTVHFVNPMAGREIVAGLDQWMTRNGYQNVSQLIGIAKH